MSARSLLRVFAALLLCSFSAAAPADGSHHIFWVARGAHNTVYLLGSVHVLKPSDSDLPQEALQAYAAASSLVMELDLNNVGASAGLLGDDADMEMLPEGQTLADALGPEVYERFASHVRKLGLDQSMFERFQPWFAALAMQQAELSKEGFEAGSGVDEQLAARAAADNKPIVGLESVDDQLGIFAHLSLPQQRRLMLYMLDDADDAARSAEQVVAAWRRGDTRELERLLSESSAEYPELFRLLTTDRNRRWLPTLLELLHQPKDYLVVVGALHLVGRDGLVQLLQDAGYSVVQR